MLLATASLLIGASILLTYLAVTAIYRRRRRGEPMIASEHLIWGSAAAFSENAVSFLHRCAKKYGDIFTLRLVNQYLTIVMDPHVYDQVGKEKNFDFDPIQKQVNMNVFNFELKNARKMIKETGKTVRGNHMIKGMKRYTEMLDETFETAIPCQIAPEEKQWERMGLRTMCAKSIFNALFFTIFGREHHEMFNPERVYHNFEAFHVYFNYFWLGVPKKCFPSAMKALGELVCQPTAEEMMGRDDLSDYIRTAVKYMKDHGQTESDIMGHNLVYLHVNYNTFRLSFWLTYYLLKDPEAYAAIMEEINQLLEENLNESTNTVTLNTADIEDLKVLDSVISETSRLSSGVFMVRYIKEDTWFSTSQGEKYLMRKGDRVAVYPPAIHKDPEIFEDPLEYKYDRFVDAKFYKYGQEVKNPVMAFGTICPGKRFALLQAKWFLLKLLTTYDIELLPGESTELDVEYHGHEILPPKNDVQIQMKAKLNPPKIVYE